MVSDSVIQNKGQVIAVYPAGVLPLEPPRQNASKLYLTNDMAERKRKLIDLGEAFVILAGGFGTLEDQSNSRAPCYFCRSKILSTTF